MLGVTDGRVSRSTRRVCSAAGARHGRARRLPPTAHPLAQVRQAAVDVARAQEDVLARTDLPARLPAVERLRARQRRESERRSSTAASDGLGLDRANWAAGVQVVFPEPVRLLEPARAQGGRGRVGTRARPRCYDEALLTITSQQQAAAAMVQAARAVAANTPVQLAAAQQSEAQARARYQAGLAEHRRSRRRAEPARAGRSPGPARARGRVARAAGARPSRRATSTPFLTLVRP